MNRLSYSSPIDPNEGIAAQIKALQQQVAELQRGASLRRRRGTTVTRSSNQSMAGSALTAVSFTTEVADTDGFIAVTSSTVTIPAGLGGLYAVTFTAAFAASFDGYARIRRNGGSAAGDRWQTTSGTIGGISHSVTIPLAAGDTIDVAIWNNGSAVNLTSAGLNVYRVGP